ncbi:CapA family protein [Candidatus Poribacteria bacterium]|nr:CapA family protein [Candidatus Poribacteria bacterium]
MKLVITGDVMLGRLVDQHVIRKTDMSSEYVWGDCMDLFYEADLRLTNLECVISSLGEPWRPLEKAFHFRAHPRAIEALTAAQIDFVSLANNHTLDYGTEALVECLFLLERAGITHAGAGRNKTEAEAPAFLDAKGSTVAVISVTDNEPSWEAKDSTPGTFYVDYGPKGLTAPYRSYVERAIAKVRDRADLLIVSAHVGPNWGPPSRAMQALAHELVDMGFDMFWGHSNHAPLPVEIYQKRPILYGTGDFIDDYAVDRRERNDLSFLFALDWQDNGWRLTLYPTKIKGFQANRVYGEEAALVMDRMALGSRVFGTDVHRMDDRIVISEAKGERAKAKESE